MVEILWSKAITGILVIFIITIVITLASNLIPQATQSAFAAMGLTDTKTGVEKDSRYISIEKTTPGILNDGSTAFYAYESNDWRGSKLKIKSDEITLTFDKRYNKDTLYCIEVLESEQTQSPNDKNQWKYVSEPYNEDFILTFKFKSLTEPNKEMIFFKFDKEYGWRFSDDGKVWLLLEMLLPDEDIIKNDNLRSINQKVEDSVHLSKSLLDMQHSIEQFDIESDNQEIMDQYRSKEYRNGIVILVNFLLRKANEEPYNLEILTDNKPIKSFSVNNNKIPNKEEILKDIFKASELVPFEEYTSMVEISKKSPEEIMIKNFKSGGKNTLFGKNHDYYYMIKFNSCFKSFSGLPINPNQAVIKFSID